MAEFAGQLVLPPPLDPALVPEPKRWKSTPLQLANARSKRLVGIEKSRAAEALEGKRTTDLQLQDIVSCVPGVARIVGLPASRAIVGRMKTLSPWNFRWLAVVVHLARSVPLRVGVNRLRLLFAARTLLLRRQARGLQVLLRNADLCRRSLARAPTYFAHLAYSHEWDETSSAFKAFGSQIGGRMGVHMQCMQQRGQMTIKLMCSEKNKSAEWTEEWLCAPIIVRGTKAQDLEPALAASMPKPLQVLGDLQALRRAVSGFHVYTFAPIGDAHSSNILLMKAWCMAIEDNREVLGPRILCAPDTCQAHSHHRGKKGIRCLKMHTGRHASMARLIRHERNLRDITRAMQQDIRGRVRRVPRDNPELVHAERLRAALNLLYDVDEPADIMSSRSSRESQFLKDLKELPTVINDDLTKHEWNHFCVVGPDMKPCCSSEAACQERIADLIVRVCFGKAEQVPGEEKWTYMLKSFKKTVLRKLLKGAGIIHRGMFERRDDRHTRVPDDGDDEDHNEATQGAVRIERVCSYLADDNNIHQLAIHVVVVKLAEGLVYSLLGGVDKDKMPHKVEHLLHRTDSPIKQCMCRLLTLLSGGFGDADNRYWGILRLLRAPCASQAYKKFAMGQILRMHALVWRRWVLKFTGWPFVLHRLYSNQWSPADKHVVALRLHTARPCCLDTYARGFRALYPSVEESLSAPAAECARTSLASMRLVTDFAERTHAVCRCASSSTTSPKAFSHTSNEVLLKQAMTVHLHNGGLSLEALRSGQGTQHGNEAIRCALLHVPSASLDDGGGDEHDGAEPSELPVDGGDEDLFGDFGHLGVDPLPALMDGDGANHQQVAHPPDVGLLDRIFEPARLQHEGADAPLVSAQRSTPAEEGGGRKRRRGLNPKLMFRNARLHAAKEASPEGHMSAEESRRVGEHASKTWEDMSAKQRDDWVQEYHEWREGTHESPEVVHAPYKCHWGGGCRRTVISPSDFFEYHQREGWPTNAEVFHGSQYAAEPNMAFNFDDAKAFKMWGCDRLPRNICRRDIIDDHKFDMVDKGLANWMMHLGRDKVDSGTAMALVFGKDSVGEQASCTWVAALLVGALYNPMVSEWTQCRFRDCALRHMAVLTPPFDVEIDVMQCALSEEGEHIHAMTSAEFVHKLVDIHDYAEVLLHEADYDVLDMEDGSLRVLRIKGFKVVGSLWSPGMQRPGIARPPRARAGPGLRMGDPLQQRPPPAGRAQRAGGRGRRGGHRGRGPVAPAAESDGDDNASDLQVEAFEVDVLDVSEQGESDMFSDGGIDELNYQDEDAARHDDGVEPADSLLADAVEEDARVTGLAAEERSDGGEPLAPPAPPPVELAVPPMAHDAVHGPSHNFKWEDYVLYPSGRLYEGAGRQVATVNRGNPRHCLSVRCMYHTKCSFIVPLRCAPSDDQVKQWLTKVPKNESTDTDAQKERKRTEHLALASVWSAAGAARAAASASSTGV